MKVCTDSCLFGAWMASRTEQKMIKPESILDIGTGTGLLALMLAQKSGAIIHAVDIDKSSFMQASENFNTSPWNTRLRAFHSDIKDWEAPYKYDLIIVNPPFYENDLLPEEAGKSISKHSASLNLKDLLLKIKIILNPNGYFAILLPWRRSKPFEDALPSYPLFIKEKIEVKQTPKHNFFRTMLLLQNEKTPTLKSELVIKSTDDYTPQFIDLLKDYYLYL